MGRRERIEARLAKRQQWAAGREAKAAAVAREGERYRGDHAFNTQPGHIPERARLIAREERAFGDLKMAQHHRSRAGGLADMLDRTIFTDDADAAERLEEKIAGLELRRDRMKQVNAEARRGEGWVERLAAAGFTLTEEERGDIRSVATYQPEATKGGKTPFPGYALSNLGGNIRRLKERLPQVRELAEQRARVREALDQERADA